jgi:hypothetical protein
VRYYITDGFPYDRLTLGSGNYYAFNIFGSSIYFFFFFLKNIQAMWLGSDIGLGFKYSLPDMGIVGVFYTPRGGLSGEFRKAISFK